MSKFKVGDTVMVRYWDDMAREYGTDERGHIPMRYGLFQKEMRPYCGQMGKIAEISQEEYIRLDLTFKKMIPFPKDPDKITWKEEMLTLIVASKELTLEEKIDGILEQAKKAILRELS